MLDDIVPRALFAKMGNLREIPLFWGILLKSLLLTASIPPIDAILLLMACLLKFLGLIIILWGLFVVGGE